MTQYDPQQQKLKIKHCLENENCEDTLRHFSDFTPT